MSLKRAIESVGGVLTIENGVSKMTGGDIGLNVYPIFDANYRPTLNGKIIDHYLNREIGLETIDMFKLAMRRKMNEIMPIYNKLYLSEQLTFDPLATIDLRTVTENTANQTNTNNATNTAESTNDSKSRSTNLETPQTALSGNADYASSAVDVNGQSEVNSTANEESTFTSENEGAGETHTTGYQGVPSELLMAYRASLLNIDLSVINELEECFMSVWETSDSYTRGYYY